MLRATGSAPILKKNKFAISDQEKFKTVVDTLRKMLHLQPGESVVRLLCFLKLLSRLPTERDILLIVVCLHKPGLPAVPRRDRCQFVSGN